MRTRRLSLLVGLLVAAPLEVAAAQDPEPLRIAAGAGLTFRHQERGALGGELGMHLQLSALRWLSRHAGVRTDAALSFFPVSAAATPECVPDAVCNAWRSLSFAGGAGVSIMTRPRSRSPEMTVFAGPGAYWAATGNVGGRESDGARSHLAFGVTAGVGTGGARVGGARLGLEMRLHWFPAGLGEIQWLATPAVTLGF